MNLSSGSEPDSEFDEFAELHDETSSSKPSPQSDAGDRHSHSGPWFIRFAGRRSGPFDAERLRTLARRGALSRMHSLSIDGKKWTAATEVRAVFNADGSVVSAGVRAVELELDPDSEPQWGQPEVAMELPMFAAVRRAFGGALVRPVVICALALATIMLALPTSRDDAFELAWWWHEDPISIAVHGLCAFAVVGGWVVAFLTPEPARAASVSAVSAVLAAAATVALALWAPWALAAGLLVPVAALLVALDAAGSGGARSMGIAALVTAVLMGGSCIALGIMNFSEWVLVGMILGGIGAAATGLAGFLAFRKVGPNADGVFWSGVVGATGALGAVFAAAFAGLAGPQPMNGAQAAVAACLVLSFSALSWAAVHESVETSDQLPPAESME